MDRTKSAYIRRVAWIAPLVAALMVAPHPAILLIATAAGAASGALVAKSWPTFRDRLRHRAIFLARIGEIDRLYTSGSRT